MGDDFFGAVAVGAEVAEDDLVEGGVRDVADDFFDLGVREVAVAGSDALFNRPRTFGIEFEQFVIVVGFDEEGGEFFKMNFNAGSYVSRI